MLTEIRAFCYNQSTGATENAGVDNVAPSSRVENAGVSDSGK